MIEDGSCVYGPLECGGVSTVTYDGYTYDLVAIGDQCWFAENLRNEHYANGDAIPGDLSDGEWMQHNDWRVRLRRGTSSLAAVTMKSNLADYGRLYNWYAVDDCAWVVPKRLARPDGWGVHDTSNDIGHERIGGERDRRARHRPRHTDEIVSIRLTCMERHEHERFFRFGWWLPVLPVGTSTMEATTVISGRLRRTDKRLVP